MRIAILGATSQIARDLTASLAATGQHELSLFARRPDAVTEWAKQLGLHDMARIGSFEHFTTHEHYDAIINFVGVGNPAAAQAMGASILDVTLQYDSLAIDYLKAHPGTRYIFLSSGAAYGSSFAQSVNDDTPATFAINHLQAQDWYGAAKFHAECRHRALPELAIVDIRVFSYFSHTQDLNARFFISDILRAIQSGQTLQTSAENIVRDYIGPQEMLQLVSCILNSAPTNAAVDCFTLAPVDKLTLLATMQERFGLQYAVSAASVTVNATGSKLNYYSTSRHANQLFSYQPTRDSLQVLQEHIAKI